MGPSPTDRPTRSEYEADSEVEPSANPHTATTERASEHDQPTLRTDSDAPADSANSAPWRARYEDLGELARGGMSSILLVFDRVVRRRVAMKVHDRERDPTGLAHFIEEARITGQLDHPNIIPVHDVQHDEAGRPTRFTMKLVEGETLADVIERHAGKPMQAAELERLLGIFLKICDAISFAHSRGVVHCDIKPTNVLVGSFGEVYVTDWGVAQRRTAQPGGDEASAQPQPPATLSGTPAYMAPEQAFGKRAAIDERTDIYGLGGVLYAMLTVSPPHNGGSTDADLDLARRGFVRRPQDVVKDRALPPGLCRITMQALEADPGQRYPSVEALKADVESFMRGGGWFESVRLPQGALVMREGDLPDAAYILIDGHCELYHSVAGEQRFMRVLGPGDVFGETSIFGSSMRTASILASSDVTLMRVTREALERELERTEWLKSFVEALAQRFIELDRKVRELGG